MQSAVLSPHLDDAVLSCWSLLEAAGEVTVVNVFTASPPPGTPVPEWDRRTGATDPVRRMRERREEDRTALALVGRTAVALEFLDVQYGRRAMPVSVLADRFRVLFAPDVVLHAPAGLGRHPDHEFVRDAALELAREGRPVALYADLPHCIPRGWPAWVAATPEVDGLDVAAEWTTVLAEAGLVVERLIPRVRPLDVGARGRKLRALAAYRTQRDALDDMAFTPLEDPRGLAFEVRWDVTPSALDVPQQPRSELGVAEARSETLHHSG